LLTLSALVASISPADYFQTLFLCWIPGQARNDENEDTVMLSLLRIRPDEIFLRNVNKTR
jgi:hypothetical protein